MTASVQTKIILPSDGKVYDLTIDHKKSFFDRMERTYKCLDQTGATLLDFHCVTLNEIRVKCLYIPASTIAAGHHSDLAELVAEASCHFGFEGRFEVWERTLDDREPWLSLALKGFKIEIVPNGDFHFSFSEDSTIKQKIQDHPMISPALWEHLSKVGDATMRDEVFAEAAPENLAAREAPPPEGEPDDRKGSWIGRAFNYIFCFGWAANLWNLVCGH